ncbi:hypothetical protein [Hydrogenophaga sp.]|uniref:hypothetical protein n=1 Tax=Hydrogenophaga sp. TaxID=1904254 RepID=UPI00262FAC2E|nr:hypothetical protein [Hydrogenophaga sp.]MDM7948590.1 hypothetical protein [Hydrogenophaga sp.]
MWFDEARAWRLGLSASQVVVAQPRGWFGRFSADQVERIEVEGTAEAVPVWQPAVDALASRLKVAGGKPLLRLNLASDLVRWLLVPWSSQLSSMEELKAYAQLQFRATFGEVATGWRLGLSQPVPGQPSLVCAVDEALLLALMGLETDLGARLLRIEPYVSAAFDRWRSRLGRRAAWVLVAEPELLTLALMDGGQWLGVRQMRRIGSDPLDLNQLRSAQAQLRSVWEGDTSDDLPLWIIGEKDAALGEIDRSARWLQPGGALQGASANSRLAWGV